MEDLAGLEMITFKLQTAMMKQVSMSDEEWNKAYQRIMQGGSNTLDVEAMIAYNKEDRRLPFRDHE